MLNKYMKVGPILKEWIDSKGRKLNYGADKMGIAPSTLSNKLRQDNMRIDSLMDLCEAYEIDTGELGQILRNGERAFQDIEKLQLAGFGMNKFEYGVCWGKLFELTEIKGLNLEHKDQFIYIEMYPFKKYAQYVYFQRRPETEKEIVWQMKDAWKLKYEDVISWLQK